MDLSCHEELMKAESDCIVAAELADTAGDNLVKSIVVPEADLAWNTRNAGLGMAFVLGVGCIVPVKG